MAEAAKREGGARDRLARDRIDLRDHLEAVLLEDALDGELVLRLDVAQHDRLRRREDHRYVVTVDKQPQTGLDRRLFCVTNAPLLNVHTEHQLAVTLFVPAEPVEVLPRRQRLPRLDLLAVVLLDERAELVDAECVHEVLEARRRAHLAITVVALHREMAFIASKKSSFFTKPRWSAA